MRRRLGALTSLAEQVGRRVLNKAQEGRFARSVMSVDAVPPGAVVVFFSAVPSELYQLEQWHHPLRAVEATRPVVVVVSRPDVGRLVRDRLPFPVVLAPRGVQLERLVARARPSAFLYVNHREENFRLLRVPDVVHVYLGHGESDKGASASHQNMAYDYCFVAGRSSRARLRAALPLFDADVRAPVVGRPQLDDPEHRRPVDRPADGRRTVLYAPTWEGALPSMAYGSVLSHGRAIVDSVLADPSLRLVYRPHPLLGTASPEHRAADAQIRDRVRAAGAPHLVDRGPYGRMLAEADVAVVDVSSVAYDWLSTGKPLLVTVPADPSARATPSELLDRAPRLSATDAGETASRLAGLELPAEWAQLVERHFGDTRPGAATAAFLSALEHAISLHDGPPA